MSERPEPAITPESKTRERPYATLRGTVIKSTAFIALGGAIACGYGVNKIRQEESSANQEKLRITREFYKTNPNPNPGQLFELNDEVDSVHKISKLSIIATTTGGALMNLGLFASGIAYISMGEESRPTDRKKRNNQPLTRTL